MNIQSCPKIYKNYKSDLPENTIEKIEGNFNNMGIKLIYTAVAEDKPTKIYSGQARIQYSDFVSYGKGVSPVLAKASAYAELAERFSSGYFFNFRYKIPKESLFYELILKNSAVIEKVLNFGFLKGYSCSPNKEKCIKFEDLLGTFHPSRDKLSLLKKQEYANHWVDAYSLTRNTEVKIPIKFIRVISGTNGLASGNTIEEAIVQGACEIFERFSLINTLRKKISVPTIEISSIRDHEVRDMIDFIKSLNIGVVIKDLSYGNKFPVIGVLFKNNNLANVQNALIRDVYYRRIRVGAHLDMKYALMRCLTEEMQGYSMDAYKYHKKDAILWDFWTNRMNKRYKKREPINISLFTYGDFTGDLSFLEDSSLKISFDELKSVSNSDFLLDIQELISICQRDKLDLIVLDKTHPMLKFPAVRVIIPPISYYIYFLTEDYSVNMLLDQKLWNNLNNNIDLTDFIEDTDWTEKPEKISKLVSLLEDYLSSSLPRHYLKNFLDKNISIFEILAKLHFAIGDFNQANDYSSLMSALGEDFREERDFYGNYKPNEPLGITHGFNLRNPFLTDCNCINCSIVYPKTLFRMMRSFLG